MALTLVRVRAETRRSVFAGSAASLRSSCVCLADRARRWQQHAADADHEESFRRRSVTLSDEGFRQRRRVCCLHRRRVRLALQLRGEALRPRLRRVLTYVLARVLVEHGALVGGHCEGFVQTARNVVRVVRVDAHAAGAERLRRARKLGEDEHAVCPGLAGNVLVRDQVHAVAQRGDDAGGGRGVEGDQLVEGDGGVEVVHGRVAGRTEAAVDATDKPVCLGAQPLVLGYLPSITSKCGDLMMPGDAWWKFSSFVGRKMNRPICFPEHLYLSHLPDGASDKVVSMSHWDSRFPATDSRRRLRSGGAW
eukprot:6168723-Pleurochrysis_carterae.AAC.1